MDRKEKIVSKDTPTGALRWKKIGGGSFRLASKRIIKPNQTFMAAEEEIPLAFRDQIICLSDKDEVAKIKKEADAEEAELKASEGVFKVFKAGKAFPDLYNVKNMTTKKVVNEKPMSKDEAYGLKKILES